MTNVKKREKKNQNDTITYTAYAGLEITADVIGAMYQKLIPLFDFLGPKLNFFSLTVCKSEQYLKNGREKTVLLP